MRKDDMLNKLAESGVNIAQFISFDKEDITTPKYVWIKGVNRTEKMKGEAEFLIETLIEKAFSKSVNIRSFGDTLQRGGRFEMGVSNPLEVIRIIGENAREGKHSIVNENIDIKDGGVSGVALGNVIEFSPEDTPRCVERAGICSLPRHIGESMIKTVYGFNVELPFSREQRVEFSVHPLKQGYYGTHTIIWEATKGDVIPLREHRFPNNFSRFLGDKLYGLVLAHSLGMRVPKTFAIPKNVAPFVFGVPTGELEIWTRTAPREKRAGFYKTIKGWADPYSFMDKEEARISKNADNIGALLAQHSVNHKYSGGAIITKDPEDTIVEGVVGRGDKFMIGENTEELPEELIGRLSVLTRNLRERHLSLLGEFSIEWVADETKIWIVQLNQFFGAGKGDVIVSGNESTEYIPFIIENGENFSSLRTIVKTIKMRNTEMGENLGVKIVGNIGVTSHIGDLLRGENIPSYIERVDN